MIENVSIHHRFRGPPNSGNGGYVCGLVAAPFGSSGCETTLKAPPPLDVPLALAFDGETAVLRDPSGGLPLATGRRAAVELDVPAAPTLEQARRGARSFAWRKSHPLGGCFVCGTDRDVGDGLRIFAGPFGERGEDLVAADWEPDASLLDEAGAVRPEFVWSALDCPGYFAVREAAGAALLGRLAVEIVAPVKGGRPHVVAGWRLDGEGRKHRAGSAIFTEDGELLARGLATWVSLRS